MKIIFIILVSIAQNMLYGQEYCTSDQFLDQFQVNVDQCIKMNMPSDLTNPDQTDYKC